MQTIKVKEQNVLIAISKENATRKVGDLLVKNERKNYYTGEILAVGDKCDNGLEPGQNAILFAQALSYPFDVETNLTNNQKEFDYFVVFQGQITAVINEVHNTEEK